MVLKAMQDRGWPADYFQLVSQSPEVGSTNLQEKKIDAHADFVPFAELLPFRGFARKIFDGVETNVPTWHGVVVRTDFAEKYPRSSSPTSRRSSPPNEWFRADPKAAAEKIQEWTGIDKEVVYIFLGPGGNHDHRSNHQAPPDRCRRAGREGSAESRTHEGVRRRQVGRRQLLRKAYAELKLDYDTEIASVGQLRGQGRGQVLQEADRRTAQSRRSVGRRRSDRALQQRRLHARRLFVDSRPRARRSTSPTSSTPPAASSCSPTRLTTRSAATRARSRRSS